GHLHRACVSTVLRRLSRTDHVARARDAYDCDDWRDVLHDLSAPLPAHLHDRAPHPFRWRDTPAVGASADPDGDPRAAGTAHLRGVLRANRAPLHGARLAAEADGEITRAGARRLSAERVPLTSTPRHSLPANFPSYRALASATPLSDRPRVQRRGQASQPRP